MTRHMCGLILYTAGHTLCVVSLCDNIAAEVHVQHFSALLVLHLLHAYLKHVPH